MTVLRAFIGLPLNLVDDLGRRVFSFFEFIIEVVRIVYLSFRAALFDQNQSLRSIISVVSSQIYFTGWQAMPLISVLAIAAGGIIVLQSAQQLSMIGNVGMLGNLLVVVIIREVGPLLTALIVIARSGTAVASEIGNMRVNREIEALEAMGINPYSYVVFPRVVGGVISVLCLAFYFNLIAILGGFLVNRGLNDMRFSFFTESLATALAVEDVGIFFLKNGFSGIIIFVIACYQGLRVKQSLHEVPQVTTAAVVHSVIAVTGFNMIVSILYYLNQLMSLGLL